MTRRAFCEAGCFFCSCERMALPRTRRKGIRPATGEAHVVARVPLRRCVETHGLRPWSYGCGACQVLVDVFFWGHVQPPQLAAWLASWSEHPPPPPAPSNVCGCSWLRNERQRFWCLVCGSPLPPPYTRPSGAVEAIDMGFLTWVRMCSPVLRLSAPSSSIMTTPTPVCSCGSRYVRPLRVSAPTSLACMRFWDIVCVAP